MTNPSQTWAENNPGTTFLPRDHQHARRRTQRKASSLDTFDHVRLNPQRTEGDVPGRLK
jgi:hypothetical protein